MKRLFSTMALVALSFGLFGCGKQSSSSFSMTSLDEVSGVRVIAENAVAGSAATSDAAIQVTEADTLVVSPILESGSVHVTISSSRGSVIYDADVSGNNMIEVAALPDSYNVAVSTDSADGEITIFAQNMDVLSAQNEELLNQLDNVDFDMSFG